MAKGRAASLISFVIAFSLTGIAQQPLFGKIRDMGNAEILIGVTVTNLNSHETNLSDLGGNYRIPSQPGDTIMFSSAGYHSDSLITESFQFGKANSVFLRPNIVLLRSVKVDETNKYRSDSAERREDYGFIYNKKHPVKLWNEKRPGDDPGFNFSPIGYFSMKEKQKRKLRERIIQEEKDYYVDFRFSRSRVSQLSGLRGDSMQLFMVRYRPSYEFCRNASNQDMLLYINDKLKIFIQK